MRHPLWFVLLTFGLVLASACAHAGWNLLAQRHRASPHLLWQIPLLIGLVGALPAALAEWWRPMLAPWLVGMLALTGLAQALYYLGLYRSYRVNDFALVYPLARSLPVLLLAAFDVARGHALTPLGLAGLLGVVLGCLLAPLRSLADLRAGRYWNRGMAWIGLIALATMAYSTVDKLALEALPAGPATAARYGTWEALATTPFLWLLLGKELREAPGNWRLGLVAAVFSFASYGLVLVAFQLSDRVGYVLALRQVSVPLGVLAAVMMGQPASRWQLAAAVLVCVGIICLVLGG
jgi:drug/metabolite transporter (DMT)-like permease